LVFYSTIAELIFVEKPNVVLLSSVIEYLENYEEIFQELVELKFPVSIIDRTPFCSSEHEIIYIQKVGSEIFKASIPLRIINEKKLISKLKTNNYNNFCDFNSMGGQYRNYMYKEHPFMQEYSK
jgi:putative methyltransferase (TIGR04325 family)